MCPKHTLCNKKQRGFSVTEMLLVLAMITVVAGFAVVSMFRANRSVDRSNTAREIAGYLQKARSDSMRRNAKDFDQMAQIRIFNRRFYSIAIDDDHDGNLDIPLVKTLPEQVGVEINGPFPKTYVFNWQGQTVDAQNRPVAPPPLTVGNSAGASAIQFSDDGKITVVPAVKITASR
ncbi:MAG TPA: prepilin-type N-terminal cleavage/methylation domain-containing protein [Pyrinomonadaceae bacterium]|jgi:prepilin-type N-terminal cleavage/methylation domain-containing protein|nr:prepilin-type N-terminal cleavage/methylation domain-containing protein [Pyrinomonadaceae bacterium]